MSQTEAFSPGFRFYPYDGELIVYYLKKKIDNEALPHDWIKDVNIYEHEPDYLAALACHPPLGDKHWYFFTQRDRKHRNGTRPNRTAGGGYWKATGAERPVRMNGKIVGYKRALVFYLGKPQKGEKTKWIMHEFTVHGPPRIREGEDDMRLDWVLCHIYKRETGRANEGEESDKQKPTSDGTTSLASSVDEDDHMVESLRHDQPTQLSQVSGSTNSFLPDHSFTVDQTLITCEDGLDDWLANLDTTIWGFDENCGLYPDDFWTDLGTTNLDAAVGGFEADFKFNPDGLFAQPIKASRLVIKD